MATYKLKKMKSSKGYSNILVDNSQLVDLGKKLYKFDRAAYKAIQSHFKELGKELEEEAKIRAREVSPPVAETIKARVNGMTLKLVTGTKEPVHKSHMGGQAAALEDTRDRGKFRHPVFGDRNNWVDQKSHPYLRPTIESSGAAIQKAVEGATNEAFVQLGFDQ